MIVTVLKSFPYAADQLHGEMLPVGLVIDIADDLVPGLEEEGLIKTDGITEVVVTEPKRKK